LKFFIKKNDFSFLQLEETNIQILELDKKEIKNRS